MAPREEAQGDEPTDAEKRRVAEAAKKAVEWAVGTPEPED